MRAEARPRQGEKALILVFPETAGSALYGMVDVLSSVGRLWQTLSGVPAGPRGLNVQVVGLSREPFRCGNGIPVNPNLEIGENPPGQIVIVPELWLSPHDDLRDRYPEAQEWLRRRHAAGAYIYSACSGAVLLAASGLLDGREATSHWGYEDLFRTRFPRVRFRPEASLVFADPEGRLVTAGGTTSWHDLAMHIVARHCSPGEALRVSKAFLLKRHPEGQRPYANLVRRQPHADALVRRAETWLARNFRGAGAVSAVVMRCGVPERTLQRRFKAATGSTLLDYVQHLRIEAAKQMLEQDTAAFEQVAGRVGYENVAFARRLFRRFTGLSPAEYRRMFRL